MKALTFLLVLCLCFPAIAQVASLADAPATKEQILKLFDVMDIRKQARLMMRGGLQLGPHAQPDRGEWITRWKNERSVENHERKARSERDRTRVRPAFPTILTHSDDQPEEKFRSRSAFFSSLLI